MQRRKRRLRSYFRCYFVLRNYVPSVLLSISRVLPTRTAIETSALPQNSIVIPSETGIQKFLRPLPKDCHVEFALNAGEGLAMTRSRRLDSRPRIEYGADCAGMTLLFFIPTLHCQSALSCLPAPPLRLAPDFLLRPVPQAFPGRQWKCSR